jgi:aspartyl-tRNA(Asn)/glutamyl-tRNA(Gln) amidotransferase subunit C
MRKDLSIIRKSIPKNWNLKIQIIGVKTMSLSNDDIKKIARLARIGISEDEYPKVASQLNSIFGWIDQLQQVNTDNIEPYKYLESDSMPEQKDEVKEGNCVDLIMKNAPEKAHNMFAVPKVVE